MQTKPALRPWLAIALVAVALVVVTTVAVMPPHPALVNLPTQQPSRVTVVAAETATPLPSLAAPARLGPEPTALVYDTGFGFTVSDAVDPWTAVVQSWGGHHIEGNVLDFQFGECKVHGCVASVVSVAVGTVDTGGVVVDWEGTCPQATDGSTDFANALRCSIWKAEGGGALVPVTGRSVEELAAAWATRFGPAEPQWVWLCGVRWAILDAKGSLVAFAANRGQLVSVTAQWAAGLFIAARETRFRWFLAGIHFAPLASSNPG